MSGETHVRDYVVIDVNGSGPVDNYGFVEQRLQQVVESENITADLAAELSNGSFQNAVNFVQEHLPAFVEEPIVEPRKQAYASILCVAKGQPAPSVAPQHSVNKSVPLSSDWNDFSQSIASSNAIERPVARDSR